jgi:RNA polymerase sigma-70 factor, ECF subfamily
LRKKLLSKTTTIERAPAAPDPSDTDLLRQVVEESSTEAFRQLCSRYIDGIYRLVAARVASEHDAEDIVQEVFLAMFKALPNFRREARFSTWLYRIAQNTIGQFYRQKKRRPQSHSLASAEAVIDPAESPATTLSRGEELRRLRGAIEDLPELYRQAFLLRTAEGFSYREIADILGCPPGTVDSRISRARALLADKLRSC